MDTRSLIFAPSSLSVRMSGARRVALRVAGCSSELAAHGASCLLREEVHYQWQFRGGAAHVDLEVLGAPSEIGSIAITNAGSLFVAVEGQCADGVWHTLVPRSLFRTVRTACVRVPPGIGSAGGSRRAVTPPALPSPAPPAASRLGPLPGSRGAGAKGGHPKSPVPELPWAAQRGCGAAPLQAPPRAVRGL